MMSTPERTTLAFLFESDLSLAQMKRTLEISGQGWAFGDSEWHGDYLGGSLTTDAVARIYPGKNAVFQIDLRFVPESGHPDAKSRFAEAKRKLLEQVLPAVHAHNISAADPLG